MKIIYKNGKNSALLVKLIISRLLTIMLLVSAKNS